MYGRRNSRKDGGKRIRKKNWIILALICMTLYIFYRAVIANSQSQSDLDDTQERIRNDFKRQLGDIREKMRAKDRDNTLHTIELANSKKSSNTYTDIRGQTLHKNSKGMNESKHDHLKPKKDKRANDTKEKEKKLPFKNFQELKKYSENTVDKKSKHNVGKNDSRSGIVENRPLSETRKGRKGIKLKDLDIHVYENGTKLYIEKKTGKILQIDYHNYRKNGSKYRDSTNGTKPVKLRLMWTLNNSKTQEIPETDTIFFFRDDLKPVDVNCVNLYVRGGKPDEKITSKICIHNVTEDKFVSAILKNSGTWEQGDLDGMGAILRSHPDMTLIDGGCNIGTYSVYAASLGNRVIAIDPYYRHLQLLNKSLKLNELSEVVSLLWNALFKQHLWVNLSQGQGQNLGSVNIRIDDPVHQVSNYSVQTIMLDDLVEKFELDRQKVFLKLDIEGSEYNALLGGINFFKRVNVCYVLMEFVTYKVDGRGEEILQFMKRFDLYPYSDLRLQERLDLKGVPVINYPLNAVFAKRNCI